MKEAVFSETIRRSWLDVDYDGRRISFAYPPVQGTHQESYKAINADPETVPAEGLELSLLVYGAFVGNSKQWQDVRDRCIIQSYTRIPKRLSWIPYKNELAGVFIERDLEGRGLSTRMDIPESIDGWKKQNRIYLKDNMTFVPRGAYSLKQHTKNSFVKDGFAVAMLTEEGAEIFAKTANDNNKILFNLGVDITNISSPEQRVAVLSSDRVRFDLDGFNRGDYRIGFSFGVRSQIFP